VGFVTYQVSEEVPTSGVRVGQLFYPGYAATKDRYLVYFAIPTDARSDISTSAMAEDHAGNRAQVVFRVILKFKAFAKDKIQLSDDFLKNLIPYFTSKDPNLKGTPLEIFLALNRKQREADHNEIKKLCQNSASQPLWSGPFLRLPNAKPMASFAQDRTYYFNGQEVDRQVHLGLTWLLSTRARFRQPIREGGICRAAGDLRKHDSPRPRMRSFQHVLSPEQD